MRHSLFALDELPRGQMRGVTVKGRPIVVVHTPDGKVCALRDSCAHFGAKLSAGTAEAFTTSRDPGQYELEDGKFVLRCPWHGYEFDVETGVCPADPGVKVRTFDVEVVEGCVTLEM